MKNFTTLALLFFLFTLLIGCSKDDPQPTPTPRKVYSWAVGDQDSTGYGVILFSSDSGATWVRQGFGTAALKNIDIHDIWAVDEYNLWAVGDSSAILRTADGGQNWFRLQFQVGLPKSNFNAVSIVNQTNVWIGGTNGVVLTSQDFGYHWYLLDTNFFENRTIRGICPVTSGKIYIVGNNQDSSNHKGFIGMSLNGGLNWDTLGLKDKYDTNQWIGASNYGSTIVIFGKNAKFATSKDEGVTWSNEIISGLTLGTQINDIALSNVNNWWSTMDLDQIYYSANAGGFWTSQMNEKKGLSYQGVDYYNDTLALVVGGIPNSPSGIILKTINSGYTWSVVKTLRSNLNKVTFIKEY